MPANPQVSDLHVDAILSNMSQMFIQEEEGYNAERIFPSLEVKKQSDIYPVWSQADFMRLQVQKKAANDKSPEGGFGIDLTNKYFCDFYKLKTFLADSEKANYDTPLAIDEAHVQFLTQQFLMMREYTFINVAFVTGVWTNEYDGAASPTGTEFYYWSDYTNSNPVVDVKAKATIIKIATGKRPNKLVVGPEVHDRISEHPKTLDKIKYTKLGIVGRDQESYNELAKAFGVDEYIVLDAVYNTTAENVAISQSMMAGKHALLCYTTKRPTRNEPSAGYTFSWKQFDNVSGKAVAIDTYRENDPRGMWYRGEMCFDPVVTSADCGVFFNGAVA